MSKEMKRWDSVVIGSGLAGLMAAIRLQRGGHQVLLLDRRDTPGGKCGVSKLDGYRFTIGCNDFGASMPTRLAEVGVSVEFQPSTTRIHMGPTTITSPPNLGSMLRLLPRIPGIIRLVRAVRKRTYPTIGEIMEHNVRSSPITDMLGLLAYALGTPVQDMTTESLAASFSKTWDYGLDKFMVPVNGVQAITNGLVQRFEELGGTLQLGVTCEQIETLSTHKVIHTNAGPLEATHVATTQERKYKGRPGLSACQLMLAVPKDFPYIKQRTLIHMPPGVEHWLKTLDIGETPDDYGFHIFKDQEGEDYYTITGYTLMPRGQEAPDQALMDQMEEFMMSHLETHLPGLQEALLYKKFLSPQGYKDQWGLTSELSLAITPPNEDYPPMYDEKQDVYYIGNGIDIPPGDHANSALLSGSIAADKILKQQELLP